jgi:hypothetical protein
MSLSGNPARIVRAVGISNDWSVYASCGRPIATTQRAS